MYIKSTQWPAPAKLNLFLHINEKRADGYHELQTLFQLLDRGDYLDFEVNDTSKLELFCQQTDLITPDNLILRAAQCLQEATQTRLGARIWLHKFLPIGGGVGGGSSDAATTLVALNHLWGCGLSQLALQHLGQTLGADVPLFIGGQTAFAEGIGEQLYPVLLAEPWYLIIYPKATAISTATLFNHPDLPRHTPKIDWNAISLENTRNDFEDLVKKNHPQVEKALNWLLQYKPSRMTGTGASVFSQFYTKEEALHYLNKLPSSFEGFIAQGQNTSSLYHHLEELHL
jgi:4-diphosphocytidyl-2-C-methyl-D-erythritol kinase